MDPIQTTRTELSDNFPIFGSEFFERVKTLVDNYPALEAKAEWRAGYVRRDSTNDDLFFCVEKDWLEQFRVTLPGIATILLDAKQERPGWTERLFAGDENKYPLHISTCDALEPDGSFKITEDSYSGWHNREAASERFIQMVAGYLKYYSSRAA